MAQLINTLFITYCLCEEEETKYQLVKFTHNLCKQPELKSCRCDDILENNRS
jgi:hypothetical protein